MPEINLDDTIAAVATPPGEGGIAVIRISGPAAFKIADAVFFSPRGKLSDFESHTLHYGEVCADGKKLDQALASVFRAPNSYTGQDVVEISSHGGLLITRKILDLIIKNGARHAEPGEFTKRAFLNGRMDLTQAEAVLDLIKAKSERALETAGRHLTGSLSRKLNEVKESIMKIYAHLEAFLDFPEEDLEVYTDKEFTARFEKTQRSLEQLLAGFARGAALREGIGVAIVGRPNAGKSSLFNTLLARDRAIVSEYPGTTRDVLEEAIELSGLYIRLIDTAGLASENENPLDRMGMEKTRAVLKGVQGYLYVLDASAPLEKGDRDILCEIDLSKPVLFAMNKSDLPQRLSESDLKKIAQGRSCVKVSSRTREGIETLEKKLFEILWGPGTESAGEQITRLRHKNSVEEALNALKNAREAFSRRESLEYVAEDVKVSLNSLKELVGEVYSEHLLDVIFSEFCIGK